MIVYFSDRQMQVMGLASTNLPDGFVIIEDLKTEEIETGGATFSCRIGFNDENRLELEGMTNAGNFLLRSHNGENEFYTIIDTEIDTKNKTINVYAEDAGLDLINEIAGEFEATESHTIDWYVNKYIAGSGFEIGINEEKTALRKLKWEGEDTVTARLASIATQFGGFEISYSFEIDGLTITKKYVNIHKERGKDAGITLRLNQDIDKIITTKSVANLATAFLCEGGVPDKAEEPITFSSTGYTWKDADNDFYIEGDLLKSRNAIQKWSRQALKLNQGDGVIIRPYSYNTTDPATLRAHAVTELKKVCDMEVNYEVDISVLPESIKIGDRINIVDDGGELYLSTRILVLETSVVDQKHSAILGEHLIKTSGISQKVADLAEQFAKTSVSAAQALSVANAANNIAEAAQAQAGAAAQESANALAVAGEAQTAAQNASASASEAKAKADAAQEAVDGVSATVSEMEKVVSEAEKLAESAKESADIATAQLAEAKTAAQNAVTNANEAKSAAEEAKTNANSAINTASTANTQAEEAKANAQAASDVAAAAKLDSEQAKKDVEAFGESLETFEANMSATYARKTELTETTAALEAKITANAKQISSTLSRVTTIDETANNAKDLAEAAQSAADGAQATASQATAEAEAAQTKADEAKAAAEAAQSNADTAKAAAEAAQGIADQAAADLATAKANLESVTSRVGATEQEIADAQAAVNTAQAAANQAKADAATAAQKATNAQTTAETAANNATNAQSAANEAASKANAAQATANEAKGNAATAQQTADEAKANAATAQETANTAVTNAATAQAKANQAATEAAAAQKAAEDADAKAAAAQTDLNTAKANLESVTNRVGATEEEIALAEKAVEDAQKAADDAQAAADLAQSTANTAKDNAIAAQTAAENAKTAADNAQQAADEAKEAADKAQEDVDALVVRVTTAETNITQNSEAIALSATKEEVATSLGDFYQKTEMDAQLSVMADNITSTVTQSTDDKVAGLKTEAMTEIQQLKDKLSMLVVGDGKTLMEQTDDGWSFSFSEATADIEDIKNALAENAEYIKFGTIDKRTASGSASLTFTCDSAFTTGTPIALQAIYCSDENALDGSTWTIRNVQLREELDGEKGENLLSNAAGPFISGTDSYYGYQDLLTGVCEDSGLVLPNERVYTFSFDWSVDWGTTTPTTNVEMLVWYGDSPGEYWQIMASSIIQSLSSAIKEPCIELGVSQTDEDTGEVGEGKYKVLITNTRIIFKEGSATPTYISNETLVSEKVEVTQELQHTNAAIKGGFVWQMRQIGNLGLSWKGV